MLSLQRALQSLLALLVLTVLHGVHGCTLIFTLVLHLWASLQSGSRRLSSLTLQQDNARWRARKLPKHLAIVFVPAARGKFEWSELRYRPWSEKVVLQGMLEDVAHLAHWCRHLELESLILYDEAGILAKHSSLVKDSLRLAGETEHAIQDVSSSSFLVNGKLRILLLSKEDGKPHVARVARGIAKAVNAGFVSRDEVDVDYVQEKLYSSLCQEPDLVIVLGGLHLRLRGFPPWHVRLSEIYHDASLGLLGPPRLRYTAFRRALDAYAGCEQRLGR